MCISVTEIKGHAKNIPNALRMLGVFFLARYMYANLATFFQNTSWTMTLKIVLILCFCINIER